MKYTAFRFSYTLLNQSEFQFNREPISVQHKSRSMRHLLFIVFTLLCCSAHCQQVTAKIIDADTKNPLEYVNIGIVGKNIGTVADKNGWFSLELPGNLDKDVLRISIVGFNPVSFTVEDFKRIYRENIGGLVIELIRKTSILPEVLVEPREFNEKRVGSIGKLGRIEFESSNYSLGWEVGTVIKVKQARTYIQNLNVVFKSEIDSITFRVNIYSMNEELPGENILKEPIYVTTKTKEGIITVNLEKYSIYVDGDFFASVEWIQKMSPKKIGFGLGLRGRSYMRVTSEGMWDKVPLGMGIGIFATILYVK